MVASPHICSQLLLGDIGTGIRTFSFFQTNTRFPTFSNVAQLLLVPWWVSSKVNLFCEICGGSEGKKRLPICIMQETRVRSLGQEDPLEKEMAPHSSTLAWKIPRMEEPGRLQSMGSQRVGHNWATSLTHIYIHIYIFFPPLRHASSGTQYTLLCLCFLDLALYFGELSISIHRLFQSLFIVFHQY